MNGFLEITYGPMFAGKTSHLFEKVNNFITFKRLKGEEVKVLMINHSLDQRKDLHSVGDLSTHSEFKLFNLPDRVETIKTEKLMSIDEKNIFKYDYIAIDEAQFYPDLYMFVEKFLKKGKYIHCAGLMTDCTKKPFGEFYKIVHLAAESTFLKAYCVKCKIKEKNAVFTKKIFNDMAPSNIDVGGKDKYVPVCSMHY